MKFIFSVILVFAGANAMAEQTTSEKAQATGHDMKRSIKKGAHRTQEAVCLKSDAKCLADKAKHRVQEGTDYVKDKSKE